MSARSSTAISLLALALALPACSKGQASETEVMFGVAQSLRNVMPELGKAYAAGHPGVKVAATYGASGDLRKQVEGGAPIDGVIFAASKPVDELVKGSKVSAASRRVLATNQLVLIGPKGSLPLTFATLEKLPEGEKLSIGDPGAVPAGQYARDYLERLGKWSTVKGRTVLGGDVAAVLAYARRGEVGAAIVYRTEVRGIDDVVVLDQAGADAPRVEVVAGVVSEGKAAAQAEAFLSFVASKEGQALLGEFGFGPP
jgi:molybdate transport system substrate-binding protein